MSVDVLQPISIAGCARLPVSGRLDLVVRGLAPGAPIVLDAASTSADGVRWHSWAGFTAGSDGSVDLAHSCPTTGSYHAVDPNGLLWSMVSDPESAGPGSTLFASIDDREVLISVRGTDAEHRLTIHHLPAGARREVLDPTMNGGLVGELFLPADTAPASAVLVLGGSGGGMDRVAAANLAAHGFVALALAYFRVDGRPSDLVDIELGYFGQALAWLAAHPRTGDARPAVVGRSRGGELALLLATHFPVPTVVAYVPSGIVHSGLTAGRGGDRQSAPAWLLDGTPLPYLAHDTDYQVPSMNAAGALRSTPSTLASLADWAAVVAAVTPLERTPARVLLISAAADDLWPSGLFATVAMERLRRRAAGSVARHLMLLEAGHRFLPSTIPATVNTQLHPLTGELLSNGGTPNGNQLGRHSNAATVAFLRGQDPSDVLPEPAGRWILD